MPKTVVRLIALCLFVAVAAYGQGAKQDKAGGPRGHRGPGAANQFNLAVPPHPFDLILARPDKSTITLSVLAYADLEGFIAYGAQSGALSEKTAAQPFKKGAPGEVVLGGLHENTRYYYQFCSQAPGAAAWTNSPEYSFQTPRALGSAFAFTLTADAHLDEHTSPEVYLRTLANIRSESPDFHIDLGNLFMTDKHRERDEAAAQYLAERYYLGQIGCTTPVMLALGTHDGETGRYDDGTEGCLAVWSNRLRKSHFLNPVPNSFYSGSNEPKPLRGLLQNYYAWEWGDALFVVLDPFTYSYAADQRNAKDGWGWTLGRTQYQWLADTLKKTSAKYRFVFIHNLLAGDQTSRGGVEIAGFNEWGGKNLDGTEGFKEHRPGWEMPVHQLLARNRVAVVFKAHDNFFARQDLDGIVYEMVPQPSFAGNDRVRDLENYGYKKGVFLGNSGHVRVRVAAGGATLDYVRTLLPGDENAQRKNGNVADTITLIGAAN